MNPRALVRGRGIAGLTVARRLADSGWEVSVLGQPARSSRIVTLDPSVAGLLELEFGQCFFSVLPVERLQGLDLHWQTFEENFTPLVVADLSDIAGALEAQCLKGLRLLTEENIDGVSFDLELMATGRHQTPSIRSGERTAFTWTVPRQAATLRAFLAASSQGGWTFAAPAPNRSLLVQTMLPGNRVQDVSEALRLAQHLLVNSQFSQEAMALEAADPVIYDATPAFTFPSTVAGRLLVGDAASTGDPLAGEGVGRAVRGAVLAAATAHAILINSEGSTAHYSARIARAHATHLAESASFYERSRCREAFHGQIRKMLEDASDLNAYADQHERSIVLVADPHRAAFAKSR